MTSNAVHRRHVLLLVARVVANGDDLSLVARLVARFIAGGTLYCWWYASLLVARPVNIVARPVNRAASC